MRSSLLALAFLVLLTAPAAAQLVGDDTAAGDSCTDQPAGATRMVADADQDGEEVTLICDGSEWQPAGGGGESLWTAGTGDDIYYNPGSPQVGIGTDAPEVGLDVDGAIRAADRIKIQGTTGLDEPAMP